jgi:hypothetical protein
MISILSFCGFAAVSAALAADGPHVAVFRPDLSIVTETVAVDLPAGSSQLRLDFVRGNADLSTLQVFALDHAASVAIVGQTRRDELPNALFLEIAANAAVRERLELRYVARGYAASPSYTARFNSIARTLDFAQDLEVSNDSGERLVDARVDAMFGDLRTVGSQPVTHGRTADPQGAGSEGLPSQPLVKDAAEHTIVSFGDGVTLADGTMVRRRVAERTNVPAVIEFRYRADEAGGRVTRRAKIKNIEDGGLGGATLQPGRWTITEHDATGERFVAFSDLGSIAPGGEFELALAVASDVFVERDRLDHQRTDLVFGEYNRALVSFSETEAWRLKVRNHSSEARTLVIHEVVGGTDTFEILEPTVPAERKDRNLVEFKLELAAGAEAVLTYRVKKTNLRAG